MRVQTMVQHLWIGQLLQRLFSLIIHSELWIFGIQFACVTSVHDFLSIVDVV